jgi:hypothetical protein
MACVSRMSALAMNGIEDEEVRQEAYCTSGGAIIHHNSTAKFLGPRPFVYWVQPLKR